MATKAKIGVLGASGYTGSELVRMLLRHPRAEIVLLTAERSAGKIMREVFPQFSPFELPTLVAIEGLDWAKAGLDLAFCALPHATTQTVIKELLAQAPATKVVDLSADFRLADGAAATAARIDASRSREGHQQAARETPWRDRRAGPTHNRGLTTHTTGLTLARWTRRTFATIARLTSAQGSDG